MPAMVPPAQAHSSPIAPLRLLLVHARPSDAQATLALLQASGQALQTRRVASANGLRTALKMQDWDALLYQLQVPALTAQAALKLLHDQHIDLPFILLAGDTRESSDKAVARLIQAGAHDCLGRDDFSRLLPTIAREIRHARHRAEHRATLEMLQTSEARFRALAANLPGMVFQLQRGPDKVLRFLYVSDGCDKLIGLKSHELLAAPHRFLEIVEPTDRLSLEHAIEESAVTCRTLNWEGRIRRKGLTKWLNLRSTPQPIDHGHLQWHGIATDITLSKEGEAKLRRSKEQLSELSNHLESAKEEERERIARDIHDELGSTLAVIKIETALLNAKLPEKFHELHDKARAIEGMLDQAMNTVSRVARELRPGILKEFGLPAAIECQADDFSRRTGIACRVSCDDDDGASIEDHVSLALFRIFQEALANVAKHAHATRVVVHLRREKGHVILEIRDNGRGISEADMNKPKSFGLRGIRERINNLNGEFSIGPAGQSGSLILLSIPVVRRPLPPTVTGESLQRKLF
ncbi:MAG: PAS domain S-box protein [Sterolibacterium sp.]|nr:PAS domain S-box protein [Sterolibacterium sp.]MBP9799752.1 PAS domain S-box protein [Sterolibacterium sp.]